jgi:hypothetical protein
MIDAKIKVHCTDNRKDLDAHVLSYKPQAFLEVAIQTLKIRLAYKAQTRAFVGSLGGKEFVVKESDLPAERKEYQR